MFADLVVFSNCCFDPVSIFYVEQLLIFYCRNREIAVRMCKIPRLINFFLLPYNLPHIAWLEKNNVINVIYQAVVDWILHLDMKYNRYWIHVEESTAHFNMIRTTVQNLEVFKRPSVRWGGISFLVMWRHPIPCDVAISHSFWCGARYPLPCDVVLSHSL